jgi:hypothetical protein
VLVVSSLASGERHEGVEQVRVLSLARTVGAAELERPPAEGLERVEEPGHLGGRA